MANKEDEQVHEAPASEGSEVGQCVPIQLLKYHQRFYTLLFYIHRNS